MWLVCMQVMPKISHLLQIGFGAAGAEIIRKNMGAGALNAVMPGALYMIIRHVVRALEGT